MINSGRFRGHNGINNAVNIPQGNLHSSHKKIVGVKKALSRVQRRTGPDGIEGTSSLFHHGIETGPVHGSRLKTVLVRGQGHLDIIAFLSGQRIGFCADRKSLVIPLAFSIPHKKPFMKIVPYILNPQFRIHDHQTADFVPGLKQVQGIGQ